MKSFGRRVFQLIALIERHIASVVPATNLIVWPGRLRVDAEGGVQWQNSRLIDDVLNN